MNGWKPLEAIVDKLLENLPLPAVPSLPFPNVQIPTADFGLVARMDLTPLTKLVPFAAFSAMKPLDVVSRGVCVFACLRVCVIVCVFIRVVSFCVSVYENSSISSGSIDKFVAA